MDIADIIQTSVMSGTETEKIDCQSDNTTDESRKRCSCFYHGHIRKSNSASKWKLMIVTFALILILVATIATWIRTTGENKRQSQLGLLDDGPLPAIFSGQLQGSPLKQNMHSDLVPPEGWSSGDEANRAELGMTRELRYLIEVLSPIVSQISDRTHHTDFIASRRNDETIVLKGSPQHNALAWLSHAVVCQDTIESSQFDNANQTECLSLLSHSQLLNRYSLATMHFAWNGKSWRNVDGWLSYHSGRDNPVLPRSSKDYDSIVHVNPRKIPSDVCLWKGVKCRNQQDGNETFVDNTTHVFENEQGEQIIGLDLSGNNLMGYIGTVKELRFLEHLETVDLSQNQLEGFVPKEFGMLENLQSLSLSQNFLTGSLPVSTWNNLTNLEVLKVENNFLVGGLETLRFAPPCTSNWKEFSADCLGDKPRIECPCCTSCCGTVSPPSGSLRGTFGEATKNETIVCQEENSKP
mmetsp:Transcript_14890/g.37502  ORF Transcript_14890/g.37502 Transcript_14890/m.37502 type:complete len:466 (+) Transcript_14890:253-1650(+)